MHVSIGDKTDDAVRGVELKIKRLTESMEPEVFTISSAHATSLEHTPTPSTGSV